MITPVPPDKLRPGQLGVVVLGRVIMGDIAVTLADLAVRGFLQIEQASGGTAAEWMLSPGTATPHHHDALLGFEHTLLAGVTKRGEVSISDLADHAAHLAGKTRDGIIHEAVHHGWLHHLHHQERTPEGDELMHQIRAFGRNLRQYRSELGQEQLSPGLLPYAMHFGMVSPDQHPLAAFAHAWLGGFGQLPGWQPPEPRRPDYDELTMPDTDDQHMAELGMLGSGFL